VRVYTKRNLQDIVWRVRGEGGCVDSIDLTQARDRWRALVTEMINLGAP